MPRRTTASAASETPIGGAGPAAACALCAATPRTIEGSAARPVASLAVITASCKGVACKKP
jgi:hypothetical protein